MKNASLTPKKVNFFFLAVPARCRATFPELYVCQYWQEGEEEGIVRVSCQSKILTTGLCESEICQQSNTNGCFQIKLEEFTEALQCLLKASASSPGSVEVGEMFSLGKNILVLFVFHINWEYPPSVVPLIL